MSERLNVVSEPSANTVAPDEGIVETLASGVALVSRLIKSCSSVGASVLRGHDVIDVHVGTADGTRELDEFQLQHGEGPAVDALQHATPVVCSDVEAETRWPVWAKETLLHTDVRSTLTVPLISAHRTMGIVTLHATTSHAFDGDDLQLVSELAAHFAIGIENAELSTTLAKALESRTTIGQAQGILMSRHNLTSASAFEALKRISQGSNRKLRDVATEVINTGRLPNI